MFGAVNLSRRAGWSKRQPISELMALAIANPSLISLAAGFVDPETLPIQPAREAAAAIFSKPEQAKAALQYGSTMGYVPLREAILERHRKLDGFPDSLKDLTIDQVLLTAGSNQILHLVGESLLDPGDIVLCTAPSYFVFFGVLENIGARTVSVAADSEGMIPEALEAELERIESAGELHRVKIIYLTPYFENPSGASMPPRRQARVVELAKRWSNRMGAESPSGEANRKIHILEDAAYRELRYWGEDSPSVRSFDREGDTVIVAGTFSKSFSPGVRVGWGIFPTELIEPIANQKGNIDFGSPNFNQHLMAKVFELGLYESHVERICNAYRIKLGAMLEAVEQHFAPIDSISWIRPSGGLYVWVQLPPGLDAGPDGRLFEAAVEEGVLYVPGEYCYCNEGVPIRKNTIRLSFGGQTPEKIKRGVELLAKAIVKTTAP